jgi:hypothetical protein
MADEPFNIALGRTVEFYNRVESNDPTNAAFMVMLLKVAESDATLRDYDTFAAILAGSNTEADFTNYERKNITDTDLAAFPSPDDGNDRFDIDMPDIVWVNAGGASNNTLAKLVIGYIADASPSPISDANIVPVAHYEFVVTTSGINIQATVNSAGFYRAEHT